MASYIPQRPAADPARFANPAGTINTDVVGYRPSLFQDPGTFARNKVEGIFSIPDKFTFGNALQLGTRALGPMGTPASALLGLLGVGTRRTGNTILDQFATPAFSLGMNRGTPSEVTKNPGATAFGPEIYGQSLFPQMEASTRPLAPRTNEIERAAMSAAEKSLFQAYGQPSKYDPTGKGWQPGTATPSNPQPAPSLFNASAPDMGGTFGNGSYQPWYAGQPDPYSATGNMLDRITNYDFGSGRYDNASNPYSSLWGGDSLDLPMFGPGARFAQGDPFNTD